MNPAGTAEDRIKEFVRQHFPLAAKTGLHPSDKWLENGAIDSLGMLDLVHFLEQEFSVHVSDDELIPENFESLAAVADFVRRKNESRS